MKIEQELVGKEVIDASGDQVGVVKDVEWDFSTKKVESIELRRGGYICKNRFG